MDLTSILIAGAHWAIIVILSLRVMVRRRPVGVSLAWLAVICSVPFLGGVLYLMFGENRLGQRRAEKRAKMVGYVQAWLRALCQGELSAAVSKVSVAVPVSRHVERTLGVPPLAGNKMELLAETDAIFDALVSDIDAAKQSCFLGFYIWHEGGRADEVVAALIRAVARGVDCRVSADAVGSKAFLRGPLAEALRVGGVKVVSLLPIGLWRFLAVRMDLRNHRKIVVIDYRIGYTGSQNLVDPKFFKQDAGVGPWVDAMVRAEGPTVPLLAALFLYDYGLETGDALELPKVLGCHSSDFVEGSVAQVIPSGPAGRPEIIYRLLLTMMFDARSELVITTPYFVPDESIVTALISAAARGVAVTLILPERNDSLLIRYASTAHFDELLVAGVRIARFRDGLLHTKSITVDGQFSVFGSVNLDMRSLWLNFEISYFVYDEDFTSRLCDLQNRYLESSSWLELDEWRQRGRIRRLAEDALRLASPLL